MGKQSGLSLLIERKVMQMKYILDSHTHTVASGHAYSTVHEMAKTAADKGLLLLGITEHGIAMPCTCGEFYFANLKVLPRELYGIEVMFGTEANIMDYEGKLDMNQKLLSRLDVVIASLHIPCIKPGSRQQNTSAIIKAMENPYVNIIGHPDDARYPVDYEAIVQAAGEHHILLELNNTSLQPFSTRVGAKENDIILLNLCKKYGVPVIMGSDAHTQEDIGNFRNAEVLLEETGFPEELLVNCSVEQYKKYINRFRK